MAPVSETQIASDMKAVGFIVTELSRESLCKTDAGSSLIP